MKLEKIPNGTYVIAVSGGVDSVVMLDVLTSRYPDYGWIVAHVDHGMRADSAADARFVAGLAARYGLKFEQQTLSLGSKAGETEARKKRYEFLRIVAKNNQAKNIITAHHADDVVETVALNVLRGTGWRGVCSLRSSGDILRPMLGIYKKDILNYAQSKKLEWCEDFSNLDRRYLRNRIRHEIIPRAVSIDSAFKTKIYRLRQKQCALREEFEAEIAGMVKELALDKKTITDTDELLAIELLRQFLLDRGVRQTRPQLRRVYNFVQTAENGKQFSLGPHKFLCLKSGALVVTSS